MIDFRLGVEVVAAGAERAGSKVARATEIRRVGKVVRGRVFVIVCCIVLFRVLFCHSQSCRNRDRRSRRRQGVDDVHDDGRVGRTSDPLFPGCKGSHLWWRSKGSLLLDDNGSERALREGRCGREERCQEMEESRSS